LLRVVFFVAPATALLRAGVFRAGDLPLAFLAVAVFLLAAFLPAAFLAGAFFALADSPLAAAALPLAPFLNPRLGRLGAAASNSAHSASVNCAGSRSLGMRAFFSPSVM